MELEHEQVMFQAINLPAALRRQLLDELVARLHDKDDVSPEWLEEIQRRIDDYDAGRTQAIPAEEAFRQIRQRLKAEKSSDL